MRRRYNQKKGGLSNRISSYVGNRYGELAGLGTELALNIGSKIFDHFTGSNAFPNPAMKAMERNVANNNWGNFGSFIGNQPMAYYDEEEPMNAALPPTRGSVVNYAPISPNVQPMQSRTVRRSVTTPDTPITGGVKQQVSAAPRAPPRAITRRVLPASNKNVPKIINQTTTPKRKKRRVYKKEI